MTPGPNCAHCITIEGERAVIERYRDGLICQWWATYGIITDSLLVRYDALCHHPLGLDDDLFTNAFISPGSERFPSEITPQLIQYCREHYALSLEDTRRRAREEHGRQFTARFNVDVCDLEQPSRYRPVDPTERSHQLLLSWLSPSQRSDFEVTKCFTVTGSDSGRLYLIESGYNFNIVDADKRRYCVIPEGNLPLGDQLLAQKIWLETDELATLKIANSRGHLLPTAG